MSGGTLDAVIDGFYYAGRVLEAGGTVLELYDYSQQGSWTKAETLDVVLKGLFLASCVSEMGTAMKTGRESTAFKRMESVTGCLQSFSTIQHRITLILKKGENWTNIDTIILLSASALSASAEGYLLAQSGKKFQDKEKEMYQNVERVRSIAAQIPIVIRLLGKYLRSDNPPREVPASKEPRYLFHFDEE